MTAPLERQDPRQVGPYRLVGRLGRGGMGEVFLGRSRGGRPVAVKVVGAALAGDVRFRRRFEAEVEAARRVGGFYTAQVVDADLDAERPWLVTAYIPGPSLWEAVSVHGALPFETTRRLGACLAEGLAAIHACRLVHHDLQPGNVILAEDGARLIDFGIARALDAVDNTATAVGTPGFVSPEQARGRHTGPASDVYSLGCVVAFAATGRSPHGEGVSQAILFRAIHKEPDLTGLPPALTPVIEACLAKKPADRPAVADVLRQLESSSAVAAWLPPDIAAMVGERKKAAQELHDSAGDPIAEDPEARRRRRTLLRAVSLTAITAAITAGIALAALNGGEAAHFTPPGVPSASGPSTGSTAFAADPCDVISNELVRAGQLVDTGVPGGYQSGATRVRTCKWQTGYGADYFYTLAYATPDVAMIPGGAEGSADLSGLPTAVVTHDTKGTTCAISWPTSYGQAVVLAEGSADKDYNCDLAADFARAVYAAVPR
ncbi:hypothetical protein Afil01_29160 [Actinorhabdospora filicis]|uniref:Protein kinase domain-containing protein n=1 Tax=Actinorhabdospora filicis TaxID=1785913 RepID=A0A9W6W915_9ACTN|nr:serine/threonine-protein kinase [Actinorhabdospora filicis]GLZ78109.1 hypothetical protein Afil01_29160 [Actinorhabdospora filicis]